MKVFKYIWPETDEWIVEMPCRAEVLFVAGQGNNLCIWARVPEDDGWPLEPRQFIVVGTGRSGAKGKYVGSGITHKGALVWHVFDPNPAGWLSD